MAENTPLFNITKIISDSICDHLSTCLKEQKNVDVSAEEIAKMLNLPYRNEMQNNVGVSPSIPGIMTGSIKRKGKRRKKPIDPNAPKCIYVFTRGDNQGKNCSKPCINEPSIPGSDKYCKVCLNKKSVQKRITAGTSQKSVVNPPVDKNNLVSVTKKKKKNDTNKSLDVEPYGDEGKYFRTKEHNFIVQQLDDAVVVYGKEDNGKVIPLSKEEIVMAQQMGLSVAESNVESSEPPEVPQVPQVPQTEQPQVPQIDFTT